MTVSLTEVVRQGRVSSYNTVSKTRLQSGVSDFQFDFVSEGTYLLSATTSDEPHKRSWAFLSVPVTDQNLDFVQLFLNRGVSISGKLTLPEALKTLESADAGLRVFITPRDRLLYAEERSPAVVSGAGWTFVLNNVIPGAYEVSVKGLPKELAVCTVTYKGATSKVGLFTADPVADSQEEVKIALCPATASIAVSPRDSRKPNSPELLRYLLVPVGTGPSTQWHGAKTIDADKDGRGVFVNLIAGKYRVVVLPKQATWRSDTTTTEGLIAGAEEVTIDVGSFQSIELKVAEN